MCLRGGRRGGLRPSLCTTPWCVRGCTTTRAPRPHLEAPPAPAAGQATRRGLRTWPGPAVALPGIPTGTQHPTRAPSRRPPTPHPRPGAVCACLAGPCPSPLTLVGEPGARPEESVEAGAEPGSEWRAPPSPAQWGTYSGWESSDPPPHAPYLRLFAAFPGDASRHGTAPSLLIWKPQVSERLPPPKRAPKTRGGVPEIPVRKLCPGQARCPGGHHEASRFPPCLSPFL